MFDGAFLYSICFATGKILIFVFGRGKYVTSIFDEIEEPFSFDDTKNLTDGKILIRGDLVVFVGGLFWFVILVSGAVGFWTGYFDLITPLRNWLFGNP